MQWAVNTARRSQPVIIHASTGSVSCEWSDDRLTLNLQRHLSMPSSCLVLIVSTPCLPSPQRPVTDRLQPVVNAAARVVSGTRKFDRRLTRLLHAELLWLDISQRIQYKLGVMVHWCLQGRTPQYLIDCCTLTSLPVVSVSSLLLAIS